jgi:pentose-5-phosphate-3-epimerase
MKNDKIQQKEVKIDGDLKNLVIERIKASSSDIKVSIGTSEYSKEEMLKNVEEENEIGREIVDIQIEYLRDMADGAIYLSS